MLLSISEHLEKAKNMPTRDEKIQYLQDNKSVPMLTVLNIMYNKNVKVLLPKSPPPWNKNKLVDNEGALYVEARRLRIFIEGGGYDHLTKEKRESLFVSFLESVNDNDAELLCQMIRQKAIKGLPRSVIADAFPELNLKKEKENGQVVS